jgi:hypothetical protein
MLNPLQLEELDRKISKNKALQETFKLSKIVKNTHYIKRIVKYLMEHLSKFECNLVYQASREGYKS